MYKYIEQRFRTKSKNNKYILKFILVIVSITLVSFALIKFGNTDLEKKLMNIINKQLSLEENAKLMKDLRNSNNFEKNDLSKVLLIGDSMSVDMNGLLTFTKEYNHKFQLRVLTTSHRCQFMLQDRSRISYYNNDSNLINLCEKQTNSILSSPLINDADIILISFNWYDFVDEEGFEKAINSIKLKSKAKIIIIGKRPYFTKNSKQYISHLLLEYKNIDNFEHFIFTKKRMDKSNQLIKDYSRKLDLGFIDMTDILCNSKDKICYMLDKEYNLLYRDSFHFSIYGAKFFAQDFYNRFIKNDIDLVAKEKK